VGVGPTGTPIPVTADEICIWFPENIVDGLGGGPVGPTWGTGGVEDGRGERGAMGPVGPDPFMSADIVDAPVAPVGPKVATELDIVDAALTPVVPDGPVVPVVPVGPGFVRCSLYEKSRPITASRRIQTNTCIVLT